MTKINDQVLQEIAQDLGTLKPPGVASLVESVQPVTQADRYLHKFRSSRGQFESVAAAFSVVSWPWEIPADETWELLAMTGVVDSGDDCFFDMELRNERQATGTGLWNIHMCRKQINGPSSGSVLTGGTSKADGTFTSNRPYWLPSGGVMTVTLRNVTGGVLAIGSYRVEILFRVHPKTREWLTIEHGAPTVT